MDLVVETMSILVQVNHGEERHTYKKKTQSPKPNQLNLMVEIMYVIIGQ